MGVAAFVEDLMIDYLIVGAALALAVFILARQVMRIGRGGGCGCDGGSPRTRRQRRPAGRVKGASSYPYSVELRVDGMHCDNCARRVEDALQALGGIVAEVRLPNTVLVHGERPIDPDALAEAIRTAGYEVTGVQG